MGNNNTEITLKENKIVAPILDINFDEVNKALDVILDNYKNIVITEDTLKAAKEEQRELASLRTNIDSFRKEKKKMIEAPLKDFEEKCKGLTQKVSEVEKPIKEAISVYDDKVRAEKKTKAETAIADAIARYSLNDKYQVRLVVKDKYMNLTASYKSVKEDIEAEAVALKAKQDEEEKVMAQAKGIIDTENESLTKKFAVTDFTSRVDYFLDQNDADGFIALIKNAIAEQKALEEKIRENALALEKAKLEEEAKKAAEAAKASEKAVEETAPKEEKSKAEDIELPTGGSAPVAKAVPVPSKSEETYKMNFDVIGTYSNLAKFGAEMGELCKKYGVTYSVDKTRSGKLKKEGVA